MRFIQPAVLFDVCPNIGVSISYFVLDKGYTLPSMLRLRDIGLAGEAHGFVWQLIVPAGEQAGMIAAAAGYPPRGTFAFHTENARLIGVGIIWLHLCHLFSLDGIRQQQYRVLERKSIHHTTQIGIAKTRALSTWAQGTKNAVPQKRTGVEGWHFVKKCHPQPVEKRPAREISRQAAKHKRYIWAENNRKEREDSRFAFHLASFLRFMAANLSLTHLETWARPL